MLVCVLNHTPGVFTMTANTNETIFSGLEVEIVNGISQALNFSVEFYETDDAATEQWGMQLENGTYTGLLGEMVSKHRQLLGFSIEYDQKCFNRCR